MYRESFDEYGHSEYPKNAVLDWIPMDIKTLFIENLSRNAVLEMYRLRPITYTLNNYGFRGDDFNSEDWGNIYLGCSHTMGIGHYIENVWSYKVHSEVGGRFWNLSLGGSGVMTHYRLLLHYIHQLKVKTVFHFIPYYGRYEFFINHTPIIVPMIPSSHSEYFGKFFDEGLLNPLQINLMNSAFIDGIKTLCKESGIRYIGIFSKEYDDKQYDLRQRGVQQTPARDLTHYDVEIQNEIAAAMLKEYESKF